MKIVYHEKDSISEIDQKLYELGEAFIQNDLFVSSHMYIDMMLIKDPRLGYLIYDIAKNNNEKEYMKLIKFLNSKKYINRITDNKDFVFPSICKDISEQDIFEEYKNEKLSQTLFKFSPNLNSMSLLYHLITLSLKNKKITDDRHQLNLTINTYPFQLSENHLNTLKAALEMTFDIKVMFMCSKYKNIPNLHISKYDCWLIYDLLSFSKTNIFENLEKDKLHTYSKIHIYAPKIVNDKNVLKKYSKEDIINDFKLTENYLNMFFTHKRFLPPLPLEE